MTCEGRNLYDDMAQIDKVLGMSSKALLRREYHFAYMLCINSCNLRLAQAFHGADSRLGWFCHILFLTRDCCVNPQPCSW